MYALAIEMTMYITKANNTVHCLSLSLPSFVNFGCDLCVVSRW